MYQYTQIHISVYFTLGAYLYVERESTLQHVYGIAPCK